MQHLRRLGVFLWALAVVGCPLEGNGHRVTEQRDLSDFTEVDNDSALEVVVDRGESFAVTVAIDSNLLDRVKTKVSGDRLQIWTRGPIGPFGTVRGPHVRITMPVVTALRVSGAGALDAHGFEGADAVRLSVSGSGDLSFQGSANQLIASVSGAGDLVLDGATDWLDLRVSGSGDADARACTASAAELEVSGSGSATLTVNGDLDVTVSGAGDVHVYGDTNITHRSRSGSGTIRVH